MHSFMIASFGFFASFFGAHEARKWHRQSTDFRGKNTKHPIFTCIFAVFTNDFLASFLASFLLHFIIVLRRYDYDRERNRGI